MLFHIARFITAVEVILADPHCVASEVMNSGSMQLAGTRWRGAALEIQKTGCVAHCLESLGLGACSKERTAASGVLSARNKSENHGTMVLKII